MPELETAHVLHILKKHRGVVLGGGGLGSSSKTLERIVLLIGRCVRFFHRDLQKPLRISPKFSS